MLYSLPPRAAESACEALRNPPALSGGSSTGLARRPWSDAPPCTGQGQGVSAAAVAAAVGGRGEEEELPYTTQVGRFTLFQLSKCHFNRRLSYPRLMILSIGYCPRLFSYCWAIYLINRLLSYETKGLAVYLPISRKCSGIV